MAADLLENPFYREDITYAAGLDLPWERLGGQTILISGASGLIASCFIDVLMCKNELGLDCRVIAIGRNKERAKIRFARWWNNERFKFIAQDVNDAVAVEEEASYVIHMASNTHPVAYSTDPVGTITTNIIGTRNMLDYAVLHQAARFVFASSNEIYGENRGDSEFFDENYCGYINSNTLRAGYSESKRCGEALCQAYKKQRNMDVVIPRFTRSYGPTALTTDTKALSQFLAKGIAGENIVLKSAGNQYYSYTYVIDAVAGLATVLLKGENGEAYNIADGPGDIRLKDLAKVIADICETRVVFELPDAVEAAGYSTATKARLDGTKLKKLGWAMKYPVDEGVCRTIAILKNESVTKRSQDNG